MDGLLHHLGGLLLRVLHRASTSVIVPDLIRTFHADATSLGLMSSMYFYLYTLEQPVVGHLSDRLGPRRVVGLWSLVAAGGCVLFGLAPTIGWASVGRALIGFGVGGVFIPGMKAFAQWFHRGEFAALRGSSWPWETWAPVVATAPLAWMAHAWGWRPSFLMIGAVTLVLAGLTLWGVREATGERERSVDTEAAGSPTVHHMEGRTGNPAVFPILDLVLHLLRDVRRVRGTAGSVGHPLSHVRAGHRSH